MAKTRASSISQVLLALGALCFVLVAGPIANANAAVPAANDAAVSLTDNAGQQTVDAGQSVSVTFHVTASGLQDDVGAVVNYTVTGAESISGQTAPSDASGDAFAIFTPTVTGSDLVTGWINKTGGTDGYDTGELTDFSQLRVNPSIAGEKIDLTVVGSVAGGSTKSSTDPTIAENGIVATTDQDPQRVNAMVTNAAGDPLEGVQVDVEITKTVGSGTWDIDNHITNTAGGLVYAQLSHFLAQDGDGVRVTATIVGTGLSDDAYLLYQKSSVSQLPVPTAVNTALGSSFPASIGSVTVAPPIATTAADTSQAYTTTAMDQFGVAVSGLNNVVSVAGRNSIAASVVGSSFSYTDSGSASQASNAADPSTYDTLTVVSDANANGVADSTDPRATATRLYTVGAATAAVIDGGFGTPTPQFAAAAPYTAVTSDDTGTQQIDETNNFENQTPVSVFFELRDANNTTHLPGAQVILTSSGPGDMVIQTGQTIANSASPETGTVDADGYLRLLIDSSVTGTQQITATMGSVSKTLSFTWTNTGLGRALKVPAQSASLMVGTSVTVPIGVVDRWSNPVGGQAISLSISGPGQFVSGGATPTVTTAANGIAGVPVEATGVGAITITAHAVGPQFGPSVNSDPTGSATATYTLNAVQTGVPTSDKSTISISPAAPTAQQPMTVAATVRDVNGNLLAGQRVEFLLDLPLLSEVSPITTTGSAGFVSYTFTPPAGGPGQISYRVLDAKGNTVIQVDSPTFDVAQDYAANAPKLSQSSYRGVVTLSFVVDPRFAGISVIFYRRSGISGVVVPAGSAVVGKNGVATRVLHQKTGQILALYSKLQGGATQIVSLYSNTITFKVK